MSQKFSLIECGKHFKTLPTSVVSKLDGRQGVIVIDLNQMEDHTVTDLPQICRNVLENAARRVLAFLLPYGHLRLHLWESSLLGTHGGLRFQSRRHFTMLKSKNKVGGILQLLLCWCDPSGESCLKDVE